MRPVTNSVAQVVRWFEILLAQGGGYFIRAQRSRKRILVSNGRLDLCPDKLRSDSAYVAEGGLIDLAGLVPLN